MLDNFTIVTKGGIVLWSLEYAKLSGNPINSLIKEVLLEERSAETSFQINSYSLKWTFANEFDLIFIAVYQKFITLLFIDELLLVVKKKFIKMYKDMLLQIKSSTDSISIEKFKDFDFENILRKVEARSKIKSNGPKSYEKTTKGILSLETKTEKEKKEGTFEKNQKIREKLKNSPKVKKATENVEDSDSSEENEESDSNNSTDEDVKELTEGVDKMEFNGFKSKQAKQQQKVPGAYKKKEKANDKNKKQTGKADRTWDDEIKGTVSKKDSDRFDRSDKSDKKEEKKIQKETIRKLDLDLSEDSDDDDLLEDKPVTGFMRYFNRLTGNAVITKEDLEPVVADFKNHLTKKNVALAISEKLVESIGTSLVGKKLSTFQGINTLVKQTMEEVVTRVLTPKKNIDVLLDIQNLKGKRPYTIVFSGVNGVGKSTNLAKVCYWLTSNGLKCMMAACDTFRSGAVEQLRTHAERLGVELFERGYGKDAANIAGDAIEYAKSTQHDVVLIDTTGRMQNNEPLMKALSKLVNQNNVDLVLFVGEALVGNDGVDQLTKFDSSLSTLSKASSTKLRTIDGIILTKFDTIDDKVGAAISMVYATGHPILFLGTGQNYTDLKRMNVKSVVKSLLN